MGMVRGDDAKVERFEANRDRLAALAYRLLGSAADAEDMVQDAYLRWRAVDHDHIRVPEAWLTKVVTNLAVDRLRSARARHEHAVGDRMPEPLLEGDPMLGPAETVEQRESVTLAVLLLMERLSPVERAVYVLREAFSHSHAEIAHILDITPQASRQHAHRARRRVAVEGEADVADHAFARRVVAEFVEAAASGRTERLVALLTDDATWVSDAAGLTGRLMWRSGPGTVAAALRAGFKPTPAKRRLAGGPLSLHAGLVNGSPAVIAVARGRVRGVVVLHMREGGIARVLGVASAERCARLSERWLRGEHGEPVVERW